MDDKNLVATQIAYYRARAGEYDQWFLRQGRYDHGPENRRQWQQEAGVVEAAVKSTIQNADVLELACGTGLWTRHLAPLNRVVAVDSSPEVIAFNRARTGAENVEYHVADLFTWRAPGPFDFVFFSFWLSHVPPARFDSFWAIVRAALKPGGSAFFIDSLLDRTSTAHGQTLDRTGMSKRRLNDGREFEVVKIFYDPPALEQRLANLGFHGRVHTTEHFFLYASMALE
jgi:SAM-dependent methyltransferase